MNKITIPTPVRKSIRLKEYDYSHTGLYFITICIQHRCCLLGDISQGNMQLNAAGKMIQSVWNAIPSHYHGYRLGAFQVMPNHIHGILMITKSGSTVLPLPKMVHRFKTLTTRKYIEGVKTKNWSSFDGKLWQRNYYEHIIRSEESHEKIQEYIINNPINWPQDIMHPSAVRHRGRPLQNSVAIRQKMYA